MPWLREHLIGAVTDYARGIEINTDSIQSRMEEQMRGIDPTNPESMQQLLEGGLFDLPKSPSQEAALQRLEITLALVEGWVDEVVGQATHERMPSATKLQEAVRRRRAAGGPAEQTFASLVGLELRPRRLRDASTLWGSLRTRQGTEARDGVWMHPDLLPTATDLDDPLGFREGAGAPEEMSEEDFDAALQRMLDRDGPGDPPTRSDPPRRRARRPAAVARALARAGGAAPRFVGHLRAHPDGMTRGCRPDHLTASVLVLVPTLDRVLLTLHAKSGRWFQFGGHSEADDRTLAGAALREAVEESGLAGPRPPPHAGPARASTRSPSAARAARSTTSTSCSRRWPGTAPGTRRAMSRSTCAWWPVDALPDEPPRGASSARRSGRLQSTSEPGGDSTWAAADHPVR